MNETDAVRIAKSYLRGRANTPEVFCDAVSAAVLALRKLDPMRTDAEKAVYIRNAARFAVTRAYAKERRARRFIRSAPQIGEDDGTGETPNAIETHAAHDPRDRRRAEDSARAALAAGLGACADAVEIVEGIARGETQADIAARLGVVPQAVSVRIGHIRDAIREHYRRVGETAPVRLCDPSAPAIP